jgi:hypothetical protein
MVGLHAKPGDASILIFKGAPYPRPITSNVKKYLALIKPHEASFR